MNRHLRGLGLLLCSLAAIGTLAAGVASGTPSGNVETVVSLQPGEFPEGLAAAPDGSLYAAVSVFGQSGRVVKIGAGGSQTVVATLDVGDGLLTGLAVDSAGRLYVADATLLDDPAPGVFRIEPNGALTRVLTLAGGFPNGLAFRGDDLYVSDSSAGTIWRVHAGTAQLWYGPDPQLAPKNSPVMGFGANGIAFWGGSLFVAATDAGRIVRIPLAANGSAGTPVVFSQQGELRGVDGITFDGSGNLYAVSAYYNRLLRLTPGGVLVKLADNPNGLDYPTTPVFGTGAGTTATLFIANGGFRGAPGIVAYQVG